MADKNAPRSSDIRTYVDTHTNVSKSTSREQSFEATNLNKSVDPKYLKGGVRESRDSVGQENTIACAIGLDISGSFADLPYLFLKNNGLASFFKALEGKPCGFDPHVLVGAISDSEIYNGDTTDEAAFQVTQFESDEKIVKGMLDFWLPAHQGGANNGESYQLFWYFLANHTAIDCFEKRGVKGIAITVGDDKPHAKTKSQEIELVFGETPDWRSYALAKDLRDKALDKWNLFHITTLSEYGWPSDYINGERTILGEWQDLLGSRAVYVPNHRYVTSAISTIFRLQIGMKKEEAIAMLEGREERIVIARAFEDFEVYGNPTPKTSGSDIDFY